MPKELDFQNPLNQASTSGSAPDKKNKDSKRKPAAKKNETVTSGKEPEVAKPPAIPEKDPRTGFMPFAVRKRAEIHPTKSDKKKLQMVSKKKQKPKEEVVADDNDLSNGPRTTRANPVDEKLSESSKKGSKRKSLPAETSTTSEKSLKNPKLDTSATVSKVPSESSKQNSKTGSKKKSPKKDDDEKRQTRLSAIKDPRAYEVKNGRKSPKYFSSDDSDDDDEPLIKSEPKNKKFRLQNTSASFNTNDSEINKSSTSFANDGQHQAVKSNRGRKKKVVVAPAEQEERTEAEPDVKKKVGRKKKMNVDLEIANSQANTTDLSENEARGRPTRKTKEAATIYMELIGRKLTLHDSSDNDSSLDSLEVPNMKRVELMENEMKVNCEKAKEAEAAEKKKREDKKVKRGLLSH